MKRITGVLHVFVLFQYSDGIKKKSQDGQLGPYTILACFFLSLVAVIRVQF